MCLLCIAYVLQSVSLILIWGAKWLKKSSFQVHING
nr:MAG TPA: hypothetical protein [Caudoviricetes sp.]